MKTIHLLDYGTGNIGSLTRLFSTLGYAADLTDRPADVLASPLLVLPGVGSATTAVRRLHQRGLVEPLRQRHVERRPILGICLGAQLMFSFLEESQSDGLGFLPGRVRRLPSSIRSNTGWRRLDWDRVKLNGFAVGLNPADSFFFNHQFVCPPEQSPSYVGMMDDPGIPAVFFAPHLCGVQFHPEKSQRPGRIFMRNVLDHYHDVE